MNWLQRVSQSRQVADVVMQLTQSGGSDVQFTIQKLESMGPQAISEACGMLDAMAAADPDSIPVLDMLSQNICRNTSKQMPEMSQMPQQEMQDNIEPVDGIIE